MWAWRPWAVPTGSRGEVRVQHMMGRGFHVCSPQHSSQKYYAGMKYLRSYCALHFTLVEYIWCIWITLDAYARFSIPRGFVSGTAMGLCSFFSFSSLYSGDHQTYGSPDHAWHEAMCLLCPSIHHTIFSKDEERSHSIFLQVTIQEYSLSLHSRTERFWIWTPPPPQEQKHKKSSYRVRKHRGTYSEGFDFALSVYLGQYWTTAYCSMV